MDEKTSSCLELGTQPGSVQSKFFRASVKREAPSSCYLLCLATGTVSSFGATYKPSRDLLLPSLQFSIPYT